jgi:hypothetical protein
MAPIAFAAILGGAYYLYKKFNGSNPKGTATPAPGEFTVKSPLTAIEYHVVPGDKFADGTQRFQVFTSTGARVTTFIFDPKDQTRRETVHPAEVDPAIYKDVMMSMSILGPKA